MLSALFILAANAWMQHPVGYKVVGNRAVMTNFWAVMTNSTLIGSFLHVLFSALVTATMLVLGSQRLAPVEGQARRPGAAAGVRHLGQAGPRRRRRRHRRHDVLRRQPGPGHGTPAADEDGRRRGDLQHRRTAPASRCSPSATSPATRSSRSGSPTCSRCWPTTAGTGPVQGINQIQASRGGEVRSGQLQAHLVGDLLDLPHHGRLRDPHALDAGDRASGSCGGERLEQSTWFLRFSVFAIALPFIANTTGWIFTEMGRQPWVVYGLLKTSAAVSHVGTGYVVTTPDRLHGHLQPPGRHRLRAHGPLRPR